MENREGELRSICHSGDLINHLFFSKLSRNEWKKSLASQRRQQLSSFRSSSSQRGSYEVEDGDGDEDEEMRTRETKKM